MYQLMADERVVNLARQGDVLAWIEVLYRRLENRVNVNVNRKG
jgi:hypothetical protein